MTNMVKKGLKGKSHQKQLGKALRMGEHIRIGSTHGTQRIYLRSSLGNQALSQGWLVWEIKEVDLTTLLEIVCSVVLVVNQSFDPSVMPLEVDLLDLAKPPLLRTNFIAPWKRYTMDRQGK